MIPAPPFSRFYYTIRSINTLAAGENGWYFFVTATISTSNGGSRGRKVKFLLLVSARPSRQKAQPIPCSTRWVAL